MAGEGPYQDTDLQYANLISNLISPPDDSGGTVPDPRTAVPAGEPPNPVLKTRAAAPQTPSPVTPVPAAVSPAAGAPKSWGDYVREGLNRGLGAYDQSQTALGGIQNQPSVESQNAPLEAQRAAVAQPLNPQDPEYRPGIGTRIARGVRSGLVGLATGGIPGAVVGAVEPGQIRGGSAYGAPVKQFNIDTARRAAQAGVLDKQMQENIDTSKADTDRAGKIASDERAAATTALDIGKTASAQETAEHNDQLAQVRQQLADQGGVPKNYEQAVIASNDPDLPAPKRQQYATAAKTIAATEVKKFQYALKASGGDPDGKRQAMIDDATQEVKDLQDKYQYDPDTNTYSDPNSPTRTYSPDEFTDMKNKVSTKLDAALAKAKLRTLGVRFNPKDAGAGKNPDATQAPAPAARPQQAGPKAVSEVQPGQVYKGYRFLGGNRADRTRWQQVTQ